MDRTERLRRWALKAQQALVYERQLLRLVKRYFIVQGDEVEVELRKWWRKHKKDVEKSGFSIDFIFDKAKWKEKLNDRIRPVIDQAVEEMARVYAGDGFDPTRPHVIAEISNYMDRITGQITETTRRKLSESLAEGFKNGEGINELSERVQRIFTQATTWRSKLIARTTAFGSANMGTQMGLVQGGWQRKMWITSRDSRVRKSHRIDGQVVPVDKPFILADGREMMYPHDFHERCVHIGTDESVNVSEYVSEYGDEQHVSDLNGLGIFNISENTFSYSRNMRPKDVAKFMRAAKDEIERILNKFPAIRKMAEDTGYKIDEFGFTKNRNIQRVPILEKLFQGRTSRFRDSGGVFLQYNDAGVSKNMLVVANTNDLREVFEMGSVWTTSGNSSLGYLRHELGHYVHFMLKKKDVERFYKFTEIYFEYSIVWIWENVSKYAASNEYEFFAECFALFVNKKYGKEGKKLHPKIHNFLKEILK